MPVFVPIDPALTTPAPQPPDPPFDCTDPISGRATVCHRALLLHLHALMRWGKMNAAKLEQIHGLQPD